MTTAIVVLLLVAGLVALSIVRPSLRFPTANPQDREFRSEFAGNWGGVPIRCTDWERQLAELRALPEYRPGIR